MDSYLQPPQDLFPITALAGVQDPARLIQVKSDQLSNSLVKKSASRSEYNSISSSASGRKPSSIQLSEEQQRIIDIALSRRESLFFTGDAGTGKSYLLRTLIARLKIRFPAKDAVIVTAPTGIAACNISGQTIHSFAGLGLCEGNVQTLVQKARQNVHIRKRWTVCRVLIIDEGMSQTSY